MTPGRRIGPYEVVRELGRGGMGVVHEVRDPAGRRLALKLVLEVSQGEALVRFRREAELMARVTHPNVVRVHALDVAPDGPFIVTELVDVGTWTMIDHPWTGAEVWDVKTLEARLRHE